MLDYQLTNGLWGYCFVQELWLVIWRRCFQLKLSAIEIVAGHGTTEKGTCGEANVEKKYIGKG